ncbi:hypothetical protein [Formosimonas limnophila]|nr:hypothetical protein [Formosimonas limnophila]
MPNHREFALIFWMLIFFIWVSFRKEVRESTRGVLVAIFQKKVILPIILLICYCMTSISILFALDIWSNSQLTATIFWFFSTALSVFFNLNKIEEEKFFTQFAISQLKIIVLIEFFIHLFVFDFWVELILMPIIAILSMMLVMSKHNQEHRQVAILLEWVLTSYVIFLFLHALYLVLINSNNLNLLQIMKDFFVIPLLSFSILPFIYFLGLYVIYENFFIKIMFSRFSENTQKIIKEQTIIYLNISYNQLTLWTKEFKQYEMSDKNSIKIALMNFKQKYKTENKSRGKQ